MSSNWQDLPVQPTNVVLSVADLASLPSPGTDGEIYFVLSEKSLYFWDSTTWQKIKIV